MARTDPQLNFRIPADLKTQLEEAARTSGRSLNQELVRRLQASLDGVDLPESIRDRLRQAAEENKRPVKSELLHRVLDTFAREDRPEPDELREELREQRAKASGMSMALAKLQARPPEGTMAALQASVEELQQIVQIFGEAVRGREVPAKGDWVAHEPTPTLSPAKKLARKSKSEVTSGKRRR